MAIISEKSFVNGAEKNQRKKTQRPQTAIVAEALARRRRDAAAEDGV